MVVCSGGGERFAVEYEDDIESECANHSSGYLDTPDDFSCWNTVSAGRLKGFIKGNHHCKPPRG
jgi:hypothetical protein